jgi:amino acid transporter
VAAPPRADERPFRLPGGHVIPFLGFYSSNLIVYWAGWHTNWKLFVAILIGLALLGVQKVVGRTELPPMDWRAGAWVLPWLAALALVSYLGSYGGGEKVLDLGGGAAVLLAISAIVHAGAYRLRLPAQRTREMVEESGASISPQQA